MNLELTPGQEFLLALERERFNVAYRTQAEPKRIEVIKPIPCTKPHNKPCTKAHVTEEHDQMMYNAGRYAAGARDNAAAEAQEALLKHLEASC